MAYILLDSDGNPIISRPNTKGTDLEKARHLYRLGEIEFIELDRIFHESATKEEKDRFFSSPAYDRSGVVEGKMKEEIDAEWEEFLVKIENHD